MRGLMSVLGCNQQSNIIVYIPVNLWAWLFTAHTLFIHCSCTAGTLLIHCCYTAHALLIHCSCTADTLLLHCSCTAGTLLMHCWYTAATLLIHCCYTTHALLIHCWYTAHTLLRHCSCTARTLLVHCSYTAATLLIHCCYTAHTLLIHCCYTAATLLIHYPYTAHTLLLHCSYTAVTLLMHCSYTAGTLLIHCWYTAHTLLIVLNYWEPWTLFSLLKMKLKLKNMYKSKKAPPYGRGLIVLIFWQCSDTDSYHAIRDLAWCSPNDKHALYLGLERVPSNDLCVLVYYDPFSLMYRSGCCKEAPIYFSNIFISFLGLAYFTPLGCPLRFKFFWAV